MKIYMLKIGKLFGEGIVYLINCQAVFYGRKYFELIIKGGKDKRRGRL